MKEADYSKMTLEDLHDLQQRMGHEIETRRTAGRDKVIQQIKALADEHGISVTIGGTGRRGKGKKTKEAAVTSTRAPVAVKYQHPQNKDLKWTGRGRKPAWINEWEGAKGSLSGLAVA